MKNNRASKRRAGFTLIEIMVVITIIGILLGLGLPAIFGALKSAKEQASAANAHNIAIAMFLYANDNNGIYPAETGTSYTAFQVLYSGKYLTDPANLILPNTTAKSTTPNGDTITLAANNNCWQYVVNGSGPLTGNDPYSCLLICSNTGSTPTLSSATGDSTATSSSSVTLTSGPTIPWGTDGVTAAYLDQSSRFLKSTSSSGSSFTVNLTNSGFSVPTGSTYTVTAP